MTPDPHWSHTSLTHDDIRRIAGAYRDDEYKLVRASRIKFHFWPKIHDDKAPLVVPR